ncbi:MAG TPA: DNA polymerase III subunit delta' [Candidatus Angelobacter sp.]|nr:DNA polymerase III subunit delta' [Candidatus Angelobacter sp.]
MSPHASNTLGKCCECMNWPSVLERQPTIGRILTKGIMNGTLAHAYLLIGRKGVGKRALAKLLAKSYFCSHRVGADPCNECVDCRRIDSGNHPDLVWVEPDGKSIKKEQVQGLIKEFSYRGVESPKKFFVIEEAETMTGQAANSLLKFIEEPQNETVAVLITETVHQLLDTIISRCQTLSFLPLLANDVEAALTQKGVESGLARIASELTNDLSEAEELCGQEWFAKACSLMINLMKETTVQPDHALIHLYEQVIPHFQENDQAQLAIDLILLWHRDVMKAHLGQEEDLVFSNQRTFIQDQAFRSALNSTAEQMDRVLSAKKRLSANVPFISVMEQLMLRLQGG